MEEKFFNFIFDSIPKDAAPEIICLGFFIALSFYALSRANIIYDFVNKFSKRELLTLQKLHADKNISEKAKITLRDKIDLIAYRKATGINTNKIRLYEEIIRYCKLSEGRLKYSDFKSSLSLHQINNNGVLTTREPNIFEIFITGIFTLCFVLFSMLTCILFAVLIYSTLPIKQQLLFSALTIIFIAVSFVFAKAASFVYIAKKIKNEIETNPFIIQSNKAKQEYRRKRLRENDLKSKQLPMKEIPVTNEDIDRVVESYRKQNKSLPIGLAKGEFVVPDNFNDPLPNEILDLFDNPK